MKHLVIAIFVMLLAACASTDYLGERFPPTESVEVFYPHMTVPEGYVVIGTARTEAPTTASSEKLVAGVVAKAREVGAHAVVIEGLDIVYGGVETRTDVDIDRGGWTEHTATTETRVKVIESTFLRRAGAQ